MLCAQFGRKSLATTQTRRYAVRATVQNIGMSRLADPKFTLSLAAAPLRDGTLRYGFNKEDIAEQQEAKAHDYAASNVAFHPQIWKTFKNWSQKSGKPLDAKLSQVDDLIVENRYQILLDLLTPQQLDEHLKENDAALRPIREAYEQKAANHVLSSF